MAKLKVCAGIALLVFSAYMYISFMVFRFKNPTLNDIQAFISKGFMIPVAIIAMLFGSLLLHAGLEDNAE